MKFIGEYSAETAFAWKERFEESNIHCKWEEVQGFQKVNVSLTGKSSRIKIFVEDNDYEKAKSLIKDVERSQTQKATIDGKEADGSMWKVLIGIICIIGLIFLINHFRR